MGRSPCCDKNGLKKGPWTPEEDNKLIQYIQLHGPGNWRTLPKNAGLQRCGKSCRLRWTNYLRPDIKRGRFSFDEEETIIQLHSVLGNKKRLLRNGIDPVTHSPRLDLLDLSSLLNSTQFNLSSLLGLQALVNPEVFRLAATLLASQNESTPELLLQKYQENNQMFNSQLQNQEGSELLLQKIQQNQILNSQLQNQTQFFQFQNQIQEIPNFTTQNVPCSSSLSQPMQLGHVEESYLMNGQMLPPQNYGYCNSDASDNSNFQSLNNNSSNQNFSLDSVLSTPTEDEKESYCSNLMKFEIPESLNFDDFM
ncbi:hypothetical protein H5410_038246 [Solanum commersonii]|uniref:Uncharacterized protein n=1 Tax=Solanum commersonii TaxID=4109 RepID=A0A9J5YDE9_SOLCO|nr:hypothetical protein H5410_038246 [Solanum commersonii]